MLTVAQEILLVEDEKNVRDPLTKLLKGRGYQVTPVSSGPQAILKAQQEKVNVVLMDIDLGGEIDGIEAAEEIQRLHALTSFIFVSAYANDPKNHERAHQKKIRVGGWIEKPFKLGLVVEMIERERKRLSILESAWVIEKTGENPYEYLRFRGQDENLPQDLMDDLYAEFEVIPLDEGEEIPDMDAVSYEIDKTYDAIRDFISAGRPGVKEAVRPLRDRLRALQEQEAKAMELRFRRQLLFDPREGRKLVREIKERLGKQ